MDYIGFFTDKDNKIIASNIKITDPVVGVLDDALAFLEELKQYYENRLDLLSHCYSMGNDRACNIHAKNK